MLAFVFFSPHTILLKNNDKMWSLDHNIHITWETRLKQIHGTHPSPYVVS